MSEKDAEFLREEWTLYGIGATVLLMRFATRIKSVGFKGFQGDDYMSILTLAMFTMDAATVHIIYYTGTNVEAAAAQKTQQLTPSEIARYEYGSKEQLAAWYSYTALIWTMKATMLFFFDRLTVGLWQHKFIKWLGLACAASYLVVVLTLTFGCFPTQKNWQVVPDPGKRCTLKEQNFLVTVVLNVITDAAILAIPLPFLWTLKVPLKKKLIVGVLLCSGLFVISAAIIRVVLTLESQPSALNINRWGVRETIVGIIAINLPILRPLFNKSFWSADSFKSSSFTHGTSRNITTGAGAGRFEMVGSLVSRKNKDQWDEEEVIGHDKGTGKSQVSLESLGTGSEDFIIKDKDQSDGVTVSTTFQVTSEEISKPENAFDGGRQFTSLGGTSTKASAFASRREQ